MGQDILQSADGPTVTIAGQPISVSAAQSGAWSVSILGTVPVSIAGIVAVAETARAVDGVTTEPTTDLVSGWDGSAVRAVRVALIDGRPTVTIHDDVNRRLLEEILVELRALNAQTARLTGPVGRDMEPFRLVS